MRWLSSSTASRGHEVEPENRISCLKAEIAKHGDVSHSRYVRVCRLYRGLLAVGWVLVLVDLHDAGLVGWGAILVAAWVLLFFGPRRFTAVDIPDRIEMANGHVVVHRHGDVERISWEAITSVRIGPVLGRFEYRTDRTPTPSLTTCMWYRGTFG